MLSLTRILWLGAWLALAARQTTEGTDDMTRATLAKGNNRAFSHTVTTQAPAETVWRLWTDASSWKDWDRGLKRAALEGPMALGANGKIIPLSGPASRFEVTEFENGHAYAFETRLPLARLVVRRSFVSREPLVFRHDVSFQGPLAGFWAGRFGRGFRAALPPTMQSLAALAEDEGEAE